MAHMIEENGGKASMFYTGETPWHGLGQAFPADQKLTIDEAIKAGLMDWEVNVNPVFTAAGTECPSRAIIRTVDGKEKVLGVVGLQYKALQNKDAFRFFQPFLDADLARLHTGGVLQEGKKIWVLAEINRKPVEIGDGDMIRKFILLSNSHDGTTSVQVGYTPIRVVCWNTLSMALSTGTNSQLIRVRHTKSMDETLKDLQGIMDVADAQFVATAEEYRKLAKIRVTGADVEKYVKVVYEIPLDKTPTKAQEEMINATMLAYDKGPGAAQVTGTAWGAYNAVTNFLTWTRGTSRDTRLTSLWFGSNKRDNSRALQTALSL